jgi:hypothetical protein
MAHSRFAFGFLWILLAGSASDAADKGPTKHLAEAQELVKRLDLKHTSYAHGEPHIVWTGTCESHADCSGFIDLLLTHSYGYDPDAYKKWFDSHRPSARRYHDAIVEQNGFSEIKRISDVEPGDLLAAKYLTREDNTGHMMLVARAPQRMKPRRPAIEGTEQWEVTVIDSSKSGHGASDTRHKKGMAGKDHDGLGEGVLRVYADRQGQVAGLAWSTLDSSEFKSPRDEHLVIGRLKAGFKP